MTEDDDWFERALHEDDEDGGEGDESPTADAETEETDRPDAEADDADLADSEADETGGPGGGDPPDFGGKRSDDSDALADNSNATTEPSESAPSGGFADADPYDAEQEDGDLFDEDFASAFENAPGGGGAGSAGGGTGPAGGGGGPSGGGPADATGGDADGGFGGGGEFGMGSGDGEGFGGGFGGGEPFESEEFDDEEFESDIPRIDVGIEGLDSMIQGGVPQRSLMTTVGSAGTGKTTFGLQFLHEALEQGENAVFITLEESHDRIVSTATEKGWEFDEYEEEGSLAVIDLDPIEMANSLTSIRNDLPRLVEEFGATRLVLDSVSLLEMMYDDQATRRNEIYDFTKSLKEAGVTTMLTSEASEDNAYASRHGIIEYLVDAVFILRYIRSSDDFRETRLAVEIQKIRDANHSREIKPYSITNEGISVYRQANIF
ncbi:KaiC domain-containing protein [Halorussus aquaticus]|uniref:KaiC domain-containing protein n=1 Tax=Halorussus aquaticus TaxID=2953748 RepID=A0ABD5Q6I0_9EURY